MRSSAERAAAREVVSFMAKPADFRASLARLRGGMRRQLHRKQTDRILGRFHTLLSGDRRRARGVADDESVACMHDALAERSLRKWD